MKTQLLLLCGALALASGCATYSGGVADENGVVYGSDSRYVDPHGTDMGGRTSHDLYPVYKQPSPSGHEMGGNRPEFLWYR